AMPEGEAKANQARSGAELQGQELTRSDVFGGLRQAGDQRRVVQRVEDPGGDVGGLHGSGCARTAASSTSAPQPGAVGIARWPSTILVGQVRKSSPQGTASTSSSRMRRLGTTAQKAAAISVASGL